MSWKNAHKQKTCPCGRTFTSVGGTHRWCEVCVPKVSTHGEPARLWHGYAKKYGLTKPQYDALRKKQGNACAICKKSFEGMPQQQIHVDHCHETNRVRGILCLYCNRGVGCFFNDSEALRSAATYLEE